MEDLTNSDGIVIAWLSDSRLCENPSCLKAIREGRYVHIIPTHLDPRAETCHLVLPTWHYKDRQEAIDALEAAWSIALTVHTATERDNAYKQKVPVKVSKSIDLSK